MSIEILSYKVCSQFFLMLMSVSVCACVIALFRESKMRSSVGAVICAVVLSGFAVTLYVNQIVVPQLVEEEKSKYSDMPKTICLDGRLYYADYTSFDPLEVRRGKSVYVIKDGVMFPQTCGE